MGNDEASYMRLPNNLGCMGFSLGWPRVPISIVTTLAG